MIKGKIAIFKKENKKVNLYIIRPNPVDYDLKLIKALFEVNAGNWSFEKLGENLSQHSVCAITTVSDEAFSMRTNDGVELLSFYSPIYGDKTELVILNATDYTLRFNPQKNGNSNYSYIAPSHVKILSAFESVNARTFMKYLNGVYEYKGDCLEYCGPLSNIYDIAIPKSIQGIPVTTISKFAMTGIPNDILSVDARYIKFFSPYALTDITEKHIVKKVILSDEAFLLPNTINVGTEVIFVYDE